MPLSMFEDLRRVLGIPQIFNADSSVARPADLQFGTLAPNISFADLGAGSDGQMLMLGAGRVYSLDFYVSAADGSVSWSLLDASASSAAGTAFGSAIYTFRPVQTGAFGEDFFRPLNFTKGLVIAFTATSGSNIKRQIFYGAI